MIRRAITVVQFLVTVAVVVVCAGLILPFGAIDFAFQAAFDLSFGWLFFLDRVIPRVQPAPDEVTAAGVSFLVVLIGTHWFGRWLVAGWSWRRTARVVGVVVLMFACGTATIGIMHQTSWLLNSPGPVIRWRGDREASPTSTSISNLKQIGLAAMNSHDNYLRMPAPTFTPDGTPLHSWHTALLPYAEEDAIYRLLRRKLPWDHQENREAIGKRVRVFLIPTMAEVPTGGFALTGYAPDARLFDKPRTLADFPNGTSNTMLAGEAVRNPKPWADPLNWRDPGLGPAHPAGFGGPWKSGSALVVFVDGSVRAVEPANWEKMTRGEPWE